MRGQASRGTADGGARGELADNQPQGCEYGQHPASGYVVDILAPKSAQAANPAQTDPDRFQRGGERRLPARKATGYRLFPARAERSGLPQRVAGGLFRQGPGDWWERAGQVGYNQ